MKNTKIVIIGAGIAGISSALYLKRENIDFVLLNGNEIGGELNNLSKVENFPAAGLTTGKEIIDSLICQLKFNEIEVKNENVQTILKQDNGFEVISDVETYNSKCVIVATGLGKSVKNIIGEEKFLGSGVSYCATCDGNFFKNLDVAVYGNNNVALEESLYLSGLVKTLYFICPESKINGNKELIAKVRNKDNIIIKTDSLISEIVGDDFGVTGIKVNNEIIEISGVFPYIGMKKPSQILSNLNPEMTGIFINVDEKMKTNIPGLFAAGDIVNKKVKQLITAASDGAIAATSASEYLRLNKE